MIYYKLGTPWKWDFGTEWRVAFEFLFAENFPDDAFVNGFWTRLKWYRVKPVSWSWVIRNQIRILGKIRRHVYILTILYPLSEHLGIVCHFFFYSLVLWRIANPLSLFVLRASCRQQRWVAPSFFRGQTCAQRGYDPASVAQPWRRGWVGRPGQAFWCSDLKSMLPPPVCILAFIWNQPGFSSEVCSMNVYIYIYFAILCSSGFSSLFSSPPLSSPSLQVVNSQCQSWRQIWPGASIGKAVFIFQYH